MTPPVPTATLTHQCLALALHALRALDPAIAARLKYGRKVIRHQTHGTWMFEIWDQRQNALLPKSHFKYCVVYDPAHRNDPGRDAYFHAWLNTTRIYRDRQAIVDRLRASIRQLDLPGFKVGFRDRAISVGAVFDWPSPPGTLAAAIGPQLIRLIRTLHPVLMPVIDRLAADPTPDGTRAPRPSLAGESRTPPSRDYTRSIPASWRREILTAQHHRCAHCSADLHATGHHIDHVVAFARGGGSDRGNLQALCPACNLRKGASTSPHSFLPNHAPTP